MKINKSLRFLGPVCRWITRHSARILMYHRFAWDGMKQEFVADAFERQVRFLARYFKTCRMDELVARLQAGDLLSNKMVAITVDDGYVDFFDVAYPILRHYGVPATIYVVTNFNDQTIWLWVDAIRYCVNRCNEGVYDFKAAGRAYHIVISDDDSRKIAWRMLCQSCLLLTSNERLTTLNKIENALGIQLPDRPTTDFRAMTWDEIRQLDLELIEVGSHTCSHPILSKCSQNELEIELSMSKLIIEREIGRTIKSFCYPNGQLGDYDDRVIKAVQSAGYTNAVIAYGTHATVHSDFFALPRMGAPLNYAEFRNQLDGYNYLFSQMQGRIKALSWV